MGCGTCSTQEEPVNEPKIITVNSNISSNETKPETQATTEQTTQKSQKLTEKEQQNY